MTHPDTFARLSTPAQLLTPADEGIGAYHFYTTCDQQQAAFSGGDALDAVRQLVARPDTDTNTVYVLDLAKGLEGPHLPSHSPADPPWSKTGLSKTCPVSDGVQSQWGSVDAVESE
ncbi:hypothetical protein [Streptomyces sp. NBC_00459]|uniref:hypothetical protein n=1 Tax=Streptomyces sp. NBC_00459 TaxID=2975749 RepID=UPI002E16F9FC